MTQVEYNTLVRQYRRFAVAWRARNPDLFPPPLTTEQKAARRERRASEVRATYEMCREWRQAHPVRKRRLEQHQDAA